MSTKQGYIKDFESNKMLPETTTVMVTDVARSQALSASLLALVEKNALGYPDFTTTDDWPAGTQCFYDRKLWNFTSDHAAGDWDANDVEEFSVKEYMDALANKVETVESEYLKKGTYSADTAVGLADNLRGQTVDSEAYLIRPTGSTENEVANGVASVLGMEGNSCVWNQLVNSDTTSVILMSGRKYYTKIDGTAAVVSGAGSAVSVTGGVDMVIDLTLLRIDNLTTPAQVEAWLARHVGTKPYYAYNAGTILSAQTLGIKTYGQNLLNPTTRQAKLIPYTWVENGTTYSNQYTIKNVPSGATATFTPDNTGVAVTVDISGGSLDITSYGSGILELSAATADTYVCMKWNTEKDNDVVPYEDPHTYDFDVRKVYGKVSGAGEYVQCFPNGMRGIGNVKDTLTASEAVVKIYSSNLGSANYTYVSDGVFYTQYYANIIKKPLTDAQRATGLLSSSYLAVAGHITNTSLQNLEMYKHPNGNLYLKNTSYSDPTAFKNAMNGVYICFERATPITYTDLIYRDGGIDRPFADVLMNITVNDWSMEEQLMTPYEDGNPTSIPATIKTQYGMDAVEAIDTLQKTSYFADDVHANLQALLTCINTNCAETLGGTFAISETATDKVFAFSFTPNVEPTNEGE